MFSQNRKVYHWNYVINVKKNMQTDLWLTMYSKV